MQQPGDVSAGLHFLVPPNPISPFQDHYYSMNNLQNNINTSPNFQFNNRLISSTTPLYNIQFPISQQVQDMNSNNNNNHHQQPSCFSSNSTSDEADEHQLSLINERKQRRMISNRESARRSRMRKQKHLDELWSQVVWLRNENHHLIDKLNHVSESHEKVVQENAQLKEEVSELRQMLSDIQLNSPFPSLRDLEDHVPCNTAYLRAESSTQSITTSMDLLG